MNDSDIVEIYSAANAIEAHTIANALEAAGIKARVVGEYLGMAAGDLPLGQPIAPRIWVRKEDEARARELLVRWQSETKNTPEATKPED